MVGNEGNAEATATHRLAGPMEWGNVRGLAVALLIAFSLVSAMSVVVAGTTAAQTESDPVLQWLPEIQAAASSTEDGAIDDAAGVEDPGAGAGDDEPADEDGEPTDDGEAVG